MSESRMGTPMSGSMSGERKRSVAAWPKQPRLSPTLPRPTRKRWRIVPVGHRFCLMIRFRRNVIEASRANHRARRALVWECVAPQHQLAVLRRSGTRRPRFRPIDRLFWVFMSWWWPAWRDGLKVIQPETVLRWRVAAGHSQGRSLDDRSNSRLTDPHTS